MSASAAKPSKPFAVDVSLDENSESSILLKESRFRLRVATVMLFGMLDLIFGAAWDGQWHAAVGRDKFLTPPHIAIYSGATILGLLCLGMVLFETIRYRRHVPGVDDATTSSVLWIFHAPLGFIVTGFGMFMILLSAPLDNYWHVLYGIDVTVWSPFHIMGLLSGMIAFLGVVYLFGSEATRVRMLASQQRGQFQHRLRQRVNVTNVLLIASVALLLPFGLITAIDDVHLFSLGSLQFAIYPLAATFSAFALVASVRATQRIGAATLTALIFTLIRLGLNVIIPPAVDILAQQQHLFYRATAPHFVVFVHIYPAFLLVGGILVDVTYWVVSRISTQHSGKLMTITAMLAGAIVGLSIAVLETTPWRHEVPPALFPYVWLASIPLAMLVGVGWGWLADRFAISVRLLNR